MWHPLWTYSSRYVAQKYNKGLIPVRHRTLLDLIGLTLLASFGLLLRINCTHNLQKTHLAAILFLLRVPYVLSFICFLVLFVFFINLFRKRDALIAKKRNAGTFQSMNQWYPCVVIEFAKLTTFSNGFVNNALHFWAFPWVAVWSIHSWFFGIL